MIKLANLVSQNFKLSIEDANTEVQGITADSRNVKKGFLFAALSDNSYTFINDAIKNGAIVLLLSSLKFKKLNNLKNIIVINVEKPKEYYGYICSKFYKLNFDNLVAVTGTNGKTSVAWIVQNLWNKIGIKSVSIGTLGIYDGDQFFKTGLTTPNIDEIYKKLSELQKKGFRNVIIEASSHGIDQNRIAGLEIFIAAITSLSRDHIDYHGSYENYKNVKLKLFKSMPKKGVAVINDSIKELDEFKRASLNNDLKVVVVGEKDTSDWYFKIKNSFGNRQEIELYYNKKKASIFTNLIGRHQINNLITAMAIIRESGVTFDVITENSNDILSPPGRLELIGETNGSKIYIDYAHTPDALQSVLISLRPYVQNKLLLVFGCGGDRDKGKRAIMGTIANKYADLVFVTDDNPRNEDPKIIRNQIINACPNAKEVSDREVAIISALKLLKDGDILLVAGKGHEEVQIVKNKLKYFSDKKVILEFLRKRL